MKHSCIGIDIIEIGRIRLAVSRWGERFLLRVYTQAELAYCGGKIDSLAARFAGKEAAIKALDIAGYPAWKEIEILGGPNGKPGITLYGRVLAQARGFGLDGLEISLSHSRENAIAIVFGVREY